MPSRIGTDFFPVFLPEAGKLAPIIASRHRKLCPVQKGPPLAERPLSWIRGSSPRLTCLRLRRNRSAVPAELLRLPGRALAEHDVDQRRSAVVHRLVEGAADVFRVLDKETLAAKGFHDAVIARAVDQRVGPNFASIGD